MPPFESTEDRILREAEETILREATERRARTAYARVAPGVPRPGNILGFAPRTFTQAVGSFEDEAPDVTSLSEGELKKRHLQRDERQMLHKPKSDWCETVRGEVCKAAHSIDVKDIIVKFKKK